MDRKNKSSVIQKQANNVAPKDNTEKTKKNLSTIEKYSDGNSYVKLDAENEDNPKLVVEHIDADFPIGAISSEEADQVVDEWVAANYSMSRADLSKLGINVNYIQGETKYYLDGKEVDEETYNKKVESLGTNKIVETENQNIDHLKKISGNYQNGTAIYTEIGEKYTGCGQVEITVDAEEVNALKNTKLKNNSVDKLNSLIEKKTGVKNAIKYGSTASDSIAIIDEFIGGNKTNAISMLVALTLDTALDMTELESFWDADTSDLAEGINKASKVTKVSMAIASMYVAVTGGSGALQLEAATTLASLVDGLIRDKDEHDLIRVNDNGILEYDFDYKTSSGEAGHYNREIKISDDPEIALNQLYSYLEMSKIMLCNHIGDIKSNRTKYINNVKANIATEMLEVDVEADSTSRLEELWEIYGINGSVLDSSYDYLLNTGNVNYVDPASDYALPHISFSENQVELSKPHYAVHFSYKPESGIEIVQAKLSGEFESVSELTQTYEGEERIHNRLIYQGAIILSEVDIAATVKSFVKSVYNYHHDNSDVKKNEFIDNLANKKNIHVGEIDLYTIGNRKLELTNNLFDIQFNTAYFDGIDNSDTDEANQNFANYMSESRLTLGEKVTDQFYLEILTVGGWHSNFITKMQTEDKELSTAISSRVWEE